MSNEKTKEREVRPEKKDTYTSIHEIRRAIAEIRNRSAVKPVTPGHEKRDVKEEVHKEKKPRFVKLGAFFQKFKLKKAEHKHKEEKPKTDQPKKKAPIKSSKANIKRKFAASLEKAGLKAHEDKLTKIIFNFAIVTNVIVSACLIYYFSLVNTTSILYLLTLTLVIWTIGFGILIVLGWLFLYAIIDVRIYQRRIGIEAVLPDFLQLTSANIRAGMPIDQALWHAIRPNFGVLAKEMEDVAKETMSGTPLEEALMKFANKYDSLLVKRSMSLMIEGLNAGGEVGELLDKIASDIQELKIMEREMSASVTTYAIFITFAAIVAAPFLLALSSQLLAIIEKIISGIQIPSSGGMKMAISFSKVSVTPLNFQIFAITTLTLTALLSATIVAVIKKGNIRSGLKYLPIFALTSIILYLLLSWAFGIFMSGMF
jgi:Flp pilus assembly protein TadB